MILFENRIDAARQLIPLLEQYRKGPAVIMAVPRGGVPIGFEIAKQFHMPLELLLTKKIGHPLSEELAIGAASMEDYLVDPRHNISDVYVTNEVQRIQNTLRRRYRQFMGDRKPADIANKIVIIVDDGVATGNTLFAAVNLIRTKQPARIVIAVPVAPRQAVERLRQKVDDVICLQIPTNFFGVGQFYRDFSEVPDEEVVALLNEAQRFENIS